MAAKRNRLFAAVGPGILVAATGVGAGDLATSALTGNELGLAVVWAVVVGAGLKLLINEGLARWQLATGTTLLEGSVAHFGRLAEWFFLAYLVVWSFLVGLALISACGVAAHAILPLLDAGQDKILYGLLHSGLALLLIRLGGYRWFAKLMGLCIAVMFVTVVATAVAVEPSWADVGAGLVRPTIPRIREGGLHWTVALMGGVGGTLTVLCYGYWIREEGRRGTDDLKVCRIDLAVGYAMTAAFGIAMVIIGSRTELAEAGGATLVVDLGRQLRRTLGPALSWAFLVGAWGAIFSSLLGVWQSVPYLFADFWGLMRRAHGGVRHVVDTRSLPYRIYLVALAVVPTTGLWWMDFKQAQKLYAVVGAMCIPMLALALLILNGRSRLVGRPYRNPAWVSLLLVGALVFFAFAGWLEVRGRLSW